MQLVGISYDSVDVLKRASAKHGITFPLLSDPESKTIDAYKVRNEEASGGAAGVPHPTTFLVDEEGVIRAKLGRDGYRNRHPSAELIEAVQALE